MVDVFIGCHPGQSDLIGKNENRSGDVNPFIVPEEWGKYVRGLRIDQ